MASVPSTAADSNAGRQDAIVRLRKLRNENEAATIKARYKPLTYPKASKCDYHLDHHPVVKRSRARIEKSMPQPQHDLARLESLPIELLRTILYSLDLHSLHQLANTSRRGSQIILGLPHYAALLRHAPLVLRSIRTLGADHFFTLQHLATQMTAKRCSRCADFGPYLYLLTCTRTCQRCLARCDEFIPAHMEHAKALIGSLPISLAAEIPSAMSLPGVYTTRKFDLPAKRLYDFQSLWSAGLQHHGSEDALISAIINAPNVECAAAHAAFREKWENQRRGGIRYGKTPTRDPSLFKHTYKDAAMLLQTLPQADCSSITRWQTVVGCPVFDLTLNRVEKGHYCKACEMGKAFPILRCRRYDEETFKLHLRDCGRIKEGFHPEYPYDLAREAGEDVDDERGSSYVFNFLTF